MLLKLINTMHITVFPKECSSAVSQDSWQDCWESGGGNLILPVLVSMGINSKKASATTAFIVIFSSISGFLGHIGSGSIDMNLVLYTGIASIAGALIGSWLMTERLKSVHVKKLIAFVLLFVAGKKLWNILVFML